MIRFNPDIDIPRAEQDRAERIAAGKEPGRDELRAKGGVVISDRAAVLLEHYIGSLMQVRDIAEQQRGLMVREAAEESQACARRIVEYIGALEDVTLQPFSNEQWDTPLSAIGLAAAALERLADTMDGAPDPSEQTIAGVQSFRDVAHRLRQIEYRMQQVPGGGQDIEPAALPLAGSLALPFKS